MNTSTSSLAFHLVSDGRINERTQGSIGDLAQRIETLVYSGIGPSMFTEHGYPDGPVQFRIWNKPPGDLNDSAGLIAFCVGERKDIDELIVNLAFLNRWQEWDNTGSRSAPLKMWAGLK